MLNNEILDGIIFSDACIQIESDCINPRLSITQKEDRLEYLEYLRIRLNLPWSKIRENHAYDKRTKKTYHSNTLRSRHTNQLLEQYHRWYPNGKKIIPKDLQVTPTMLLHTYLGDGCLVHPERGRPRIVIATNGFVTYDVDWFVKKMNKMGFSCVRDLYNNSTRFHTNATDAFLNFIGKCPVKCFDYKWQK